LNCTPKVEHISNDVRCNIYVQIHKDVFLLVLTTTFSWGAIKFYLLAWGIGIVMVCSLTYQNFKLEI
jgi:hypothetical protein